MVSARLLDAVKQHERDGWSQIVEDTMYDATVSSGLAPLRITSKCELQLAHHVITPLIS